MKRVPNIDYKEMVEMGLIDYSKSGCNVAQCNRQRNSRHKTYYIQEDVLEKYYELKNNSERK